MYECALLRNKTHKVPVFPVFVGEIGVDMANQPTFKKFSIANVQAMQLPNAVHARGANAEAMVQTLR